MQWRLSLIFFNIYCLFDSSLFAKHSVYNTGGDVSYAMPRLICFFMLCKLVCHCNLLFLTNNNESIFCFILKKWKVYRYKQNRQLSFLVIHNNKIVNLKVKAHEKKKVLFTKFKKGMKNLETMKKFWTLGMHIYRTDKLSTDMGENYIIFIAPINKWNLISRPDKVRLLRNQSINQSVWFIWEIHPLSDTKWPGLNFSDSQLVSCSLLHRSWTCLRGSASFSLWQRRTMPLLFATHVQQGLREEEQRHQVLP